MFRIADAIAHGGGGGERSVNFIFQKMLVVLIGAAAGASLSWAQSAPGLGAPGGPGPCRADVTHYCASAREIGPLEVHECLAEHIKDISVHCREHLVEEGDALPEGTASSQDDMLCQPDQAKFCPESPLAEHQDAAYECLGRHFKELSPGCQPRAQAANQLLQQKALAKVAENCKDEVGKFCAKIESKGFKLMDCLLNKKTVTAKPCKEALAAAKPYRKNHTARHKAEKKS